MFLYTQGGNTSVTEDIVVNLLFLNLVATLRKPGHVALCEPMNYAWSPLGLVNSWFLRNLPATTPAWVPLCLLIKTAALAIKVVQLCAF